MFRINLFGNKPINIDREVQTEPEQKKSGSSEVLPQKQTVGADLALAYLCPSSKGTMTRAQVEKELKSIRIRYSKCPFVDSDILNKILDSIDYSNAEAHINNIKYLATTNFPGYYLDDFVDNGYISSPKGLEAVERAKRTFSMEEPVNRLSDYCAALINLTVDDWQIVQKRSIDKLRTVNSVKDFKDLSSLTDEEFERTVKSPLFKQGLNYASDNDDINSVFLAFMKSNFIDLKDFKKIESLIKDSCSDNQGEIKKLSSDIITNTNNKYCKKALFEKIKNPNITPEDFKFLAENINEFYTLCNSKIKNFDPDYFVNDFPHIFSRLTHKNYQAAKNILDLDITQNYFYRFLGMAQDDETIQRLESITSRIKNGTLNKSYLLPYKSAKLNDKTENLPEEYRTFSSSESLDTVLKSTEQGEVCFVGKNTYINHKGKMEKLDVSPSMFKKLFPSPKAAATMRQNSKIYDCYFVSSILYNMNTNKNYKYELYKLLKQDGDDITVTVPGFHKKPVRFKNCALNPDLPHIHSCLGNQIIEEAYLNARADKVEDVYHKGEKEYLVYRQILPDCSSKEYITDKYLANKFQKVYSPQQLIPFLESVADDDNIMLSASTKPQDDGDLEELGVFPRHAYSVHSIDKQNKTVTLVNPSNTLYTTTLSYDTFLDKFCEFTTCKLK